MVTQYIPAFSPPHKKDQLATIHQQVINVKISEYGGEAEAPTWITQTKEDCIKG